MEVTVCCPKEREREKVRGRGKVIMSNISETGNVTPPKIGVHACYINIYLHEFFEPIPID